MMVQRKRTYKKRAYKRRYKRTYRRRGYKRRFYKPIKKPEIHIMESSVGSVFNNSTLGVGTFHNMTDILSDGATTEDAIVYKIQGKPIEGKKIRLKYLYIKGYIKVLSSTDADDFNCKLMVFRRKRNTTNILMQWTTLVNNTGRITSINDPTTWTDEQRLQMMYMQDWKNDIRVNFYKKVKNLYRKYDDANNIIPFKIRIPLYDCVLTCDSTFNSSTNTFMAQNHPSTNGLYFTFLSNKYDENTYINYKYKLYYTDY